MIEVYAKSRKRGHWEKILNGPFNITPELFWKAKASFLKEFDAADEKSQLMDCWGTTAREHLKKHCPDLKEFDRLVLGNAIAMEFTKVERIDNAND